LELVDTDVTPNTTITDTPTIANTDSNTNTNIEIDPTEDGDEFYENYDFSNYTSPYTVEGKCTLGQQTGCSSDVALGLTNQIMKKLKKMGHDFTTLDSKWIHCNQPCVNQLQTPAATALKQAAKSRNDFILQSAVRSSAQQYLMYLWHSKGMCGIGLAARPGTSNHEGGMAVDTGYYSNWLTTLESHGFAHNYPSNDPVHFDYSNAVDLATQNLIAFQKLWNKNNINAKIAADGVYGSATASAFYHSPCGGW